MIIRELELSHWMKHRKLHVSFSPGMTAIVGKNGSGKSSIVEALRFVFSGDTQLPGTKDSFITYGERSASVRVLFEHDAHIYDLSRHLKPSRQRLTFPHGTVLTKYDDINAALCTLLQTSHDVLSSYVFVGQHALDELLFQSPSERMRAFQSLFRLDAMARVYELLGAEISSITVTPWLEQQLIQLRADLVSAQERLAASERALHEAEQVLLDVQRAGQVLQAYRAWEERQQLVASVVSAYQSWQSELAAAKDELDAVQRAYEAAVAHRHSLDGRAAEQVVARFDQLHAERSRVLAELDQLSHALATDDDADVDDLEASMARLQRELADWREALARVHAECATKPSSDLVGRYWFPELSEQALRAAEAERAAAMALDKDPELFAARSLLALHEQALRQQPLQSFKSCPLCGQHLGDAAADHIAKRAQALQARVQKRLSELAEQHRQAVQAAHDAVQRVREAEAARLDELQRTAAALAASCASGEQRLERLQRRQHAVARHRELAAERQRIDDELARLDVDGATRVLEACRAADAAVSKAERDQHAAMTRVRTIEASLQRVSAQLDELRSQAPDCPYTKADLEAAMATIRQHADAAQRHQAAQQAYHEAKATAETIARHLETVSAQVDRERADAAWGSLCERVRHAFHVQHAPKRLMQWYVQRLNRAMQAYLEVFSPGFQVRMSEDLSLVASLNDRPGHEFPASRLSGGQRIVASICFRLAATDIVAGKVGVLVLDEPTNHLDQDNIEHLQRLMVRLKQLPSGLRKQIMIVTHADRIADLCDQVVRVAGTSP